MEVQLSPDQQALARHAVETGRLNHEEDAVREALTLWEERERTSAEIAVLVESAEASLARGEGHEITQQAMHELAGKVKQRGRERMEPQKTTPR